VKTIEVKNIVNISPFVNYFQKTRKAQKLQNLTAFEEATTKLCYVSHKKDLIQHQH